MEVLISAAIITLIISSVTGENTFVAAQDTRNGAFALCAPASGWASSIPSSPSAGSGAIIKREHRTGLHISSYMIAHMIYELVICLMETVIVTLIMYFANRDHFPETGVFFPPLLELMITFFLIIYSSDVLGLLVSGIVKNENTAMTVMPFILIVQLVMSGMIFALEGASKMIANFTSASGGSTPSASPPTSTAWWGRCRTTRRIMNSARPHLMKLWLTLLAFAALYGILSIIVLEFVDRDKR